MNSIHFNVSGLAECLHRHIVRSRGWQEHIHVDPNQTSGGFEAGMWLEPAATFQKSNLCICFCCRCCLQALKLEPGQAVCLHVATEEAAEQVWSLVALKGSTWEQIDWYMLIGLQLLVVKISNLTLLFFFAPASTTCCNQCTLPILVRVSILTEAASLKQPTTNLSYVLKSCMPFIETMFHLPAMT